MELSHKFEIKIEEELINFFGYRDIKNKKKKIYSEILCKIFEIYGLKNTIISILYNKIFWFLKSNKNFLYLNNKMKFNLNYGKFNNGYFSIENE